MATSREIRAVLRNLADPVIAEHSQRFFKTGKGEYGEGDKFLGIRVPVLRKKVREFRGTPLGEVLRLLRSPFHEERLMALLMLVDKFGRGDAAAKKKIYWRDANREPPGRPPCRGIEIPRSVITSWRDANRELGGHRAEGLKSLAQ